MRFNVPQYVVDAFVTKAPPLAIPCRVASREGGVSAVSGSAGAAKAYGIVSAFARARGRASDIAQSTRSAETAASADG